MLKLQYFGHLMQRTDSLEKTLMVGKIEGGRRRGREDEVVGWHHWLNGHESEQAPGVGDGQGGLGCCKEGLQRADTTEQLNWTEGTLMAPPGTCMMEKQDRSLTEWTKIMSPVRNRLTSYASGCDNLRSTGDLSSVLVVTQNLNHQEMSNRRFYLNNTSVLQKMSVIKDKGWEDIFKIKWD